MKKIISLLLSLTLILGCVLALGSCGGEEEPPVVENVSIYDVAKASAPTKTVTLVSYLKANGDTLTDNYVMTVEGNNSIFEYNRTRMLTPEEAIELGADSRYYTEPTQYIYYKDGLYSTDGSNWAAVAPSTAIIKFDLKEEYLTEVSITEDNTELVAKISAENIKNVFGVELDVDGDFTITVESNGVNLSMVRVSGKTGSGASISINTSYTYSKQTLKFPSVEAEA